MKLRRLVGSINKGQRGFTLIELLVAMAISGLIVSGLTMSILQVFDSSARNSSGMTVVRQVQNAGHWISRDTLMAQAVLPSTALIVSWDQDTLGSPDGSFYFAFSGDGGGSWSSDIEAPLSSESISYTIPDEYLTSNFKMKYFMDDGFNISSERVYIDDIAISQGEFSDDCSNFGNWNNGANWAFIAGEFEGQGSGTDTERTLTLKNSLDLSSYQGASSGFDLVLLWNDFGINPDEHRVVYSVVGDQLKRHYYVNWDGFSDPVSTTHVARYLDAISFQLAGSKYVLTITASIGGREPASETRTYDITPRPI